MLARLCADSYSRYELMSEWACQIQKTVPFVIWIVGYIAKTFAGGKMT